MSEMPEMSEISEISLKADPTQMAITPITVRMTK